MDAMKWWQHCAESNSYVFSIAYNSVAKPNTKFRCYRSANTSHIIYKNILKYPAALLLGCKGYPDEVRIRISYNTGHEPIEKKQT